MNELNKEDQLEIIKIKTDLINSVSDQVDEAVSKILTIGEGHSFEFIAEIAEPLPIYQLRTHIGSVINERLISQINRKAYEKLISKDDLVN